MDYIERLRGKLLLAVTPLLLFAGFAVMPSGASAVACTGNILCSGGGAGAKIRDDLEEGPEGGNFGADAFAVNTKAALRLIAKSGATVVAENQNPTGYAFFGLEVESNPVTGCGANQAFAKGHVTFADVQNATELKNKVASPAYAGISPGGFGAWPLRVKSSKCATNPNQVVIENVHLFFPVLGSVAAGTFTGTYEQPGENCPGGGVKLNIAQPGVTLTGGLTAEIDNGAGLNAFLCFVSSNNVLFPKVAPEWKELQGSIWKD